MIRHRWALALVLAVGLAGCGGGGSDAGTSTTAAPSTGFTTTTEEQTTTTVNDEAVIRQFASEMAGPLKDYQAAYSKVSISCIAVPRLCSTADEINILTISITAKTVGLRLQIAQRNLGTPPREIRGLVSETAQAAAGVEAASNMVDEDHCRTSAAAGCDDALSIFAQKARALDSLVDRWGPYL